MTHLSKFPNVGTTIFTVMSALAEQHKAINLSQGFPNFDCSESLQELVHTHMKNGANQYAPMAGLMRLREVLAQKVEKMYVRPTNPDTEITITVGGAQGLFTAIGAFVRPKDEVIVIEPAYDSYVPSIETFGGKVVPYVLSPPQYKIDWAAFEQLITPKTKMIVINTPHNPTGKILNMEDLAHLAKITEGSNIIVLSDEVYEHLIFDGAQHASVLRFPELAARSLSVFSFGKTFHATGWRMGYVVAPEVLMREFRKVHQFNVFSVNTPMQHAFADFLEDENNYLTLPSFYQAKRDFFLDKMKNSRLHPLESEGTYFQLFDYSDVSDMKDTDFCRFLTTEIGVAAIPVSVFYSKNNKTKRPSKLSETSKIIRLCFAKTEETLAAAALKLVRI
ncbi:MAG: methionine aminotransferase [Saprospiraceae bacterium]|nr:methionine aminotransferase [Saprospiraceae bacterium]